MTRYLMAQLWQEGDGSHVAHFTRRTDDKDTPPVIRSYRNVTHSSLCRFMEVSGGYRTAYSEKPPRREHELPY